MPANTSEPDTITAGDSLQWTKSIDDYPADDGWTLKYAFQGPSQINFDSSASGADHAVNITSAVSGEWTPGVYTWVSYVTNVGGDRHTIARGSVTILPDPAAEVPQSHAVKTLALIEAALEGRIPRGLEKTNIDGQELERIPLIDLSKLQLVYQAKVAAEKNSAAMAAGLGNKRNSYARFTRP